MTSVAEDDGGVGGLGAERRDGGLGRLLRLDQLGGARAALLLALAP